MKYMGISIVPDLIVLTGSQSFGRAMCIKQHLLGVFRGTLTWALYVLRLSSPLQSLISMSTLWYALISYLWIWTLISNISLCFTTYSPIFTFFIFLVTEKIYDRNSCLTVTFGQLVSFALLTLPVSQPDWALFIRKVFLLIADKSWESLILVVHDTRNKEVASFFWILPTLLLVIISPLLGFNFSNCFCDSFYPLSSCLK